MIEKIMMGNSFEGESYTGKTISIESLKELKEVRERGIIVVPEYSVIGKLPDFPRKSVKNIKDAVQQIIDLERKRTDKLVNDLAHNQGEIVVFDRGPISCLAFEYAAEKLGYKGATLWMAEAFQRAIEDGNIIIPEGVIYLTAPKEVIKQREEDHVKKGHGRIIKFLRDEKVVKELNEAFRAFGEFLPAQLFLTIETGNKSPEEVSAVALQFIKNQPKDVLIKIPDFIKFARSLINQNHD